MPARLAELVGMTGMNMDPMANQGLTYWFSIDDSTSNRRLFPKARGVKAGGGVIPHDVTLPAADELNREGNGLAVIGGLTPEVVGVLDFPLELRGFRRLAVVDSRRYRGQ